MSAGVQSQISFGLEPAWGTPVTPNKSIAVRPGDGIQTDNDLQFVDEIKAQLVKHDEAFKGQVKHEGSYELAFIPGNAGYLLLSHFGQVTSEEKAGDAGVYDHTFAGIATKKSLTIEQAIGEHVRRYAGSIVHSLTFSVAAGESLVCTAGIRAKSQASATKITAAYETLRRLHFADLASFEVGGQALTPQNFELVSNNDHGFLHTLSSHDAQYNYAKGWEISGKFDLYLDSTTAAEYTDFLNSTQQELEVVFEGDSIGSSSKLGLTLTLPKVHYKAANVPVTDDYDMVSVEFEGVRDPLQAVLTNEIAAYS